jgi:hypothetical protein
MAYDNRGGGASPPKRGRINNRLPQSPTNFGRKLILAPWKMSLREEKTKTLTANLNDNWKYLAYLMKSVANDGCGWVCFRPNRRLKFVDQRSGSATRGSVTWRINHRWFQIPAHFWEWFTIICKIIPPRGFVIIVPFFTIYGKVLKSGRQKWGRASLIWSPALVTMRRALALRPFVEQHRQQSLILKGFNLH